jgi:hypothetical protein
MKTITNTTYGGSAKEGKDGFGLRITAEVPESLYAEIIAEGIASLAYRGGASMLNVLLGVESNSKVDYSPEKGEQVAKALAGWFAAACPNKKGTVTKLSAGLTVEVQVARYTPGEESNAMVRATTFVESLMVDADKAKSLRMLLGLQGLENADKASKDDMIGFCHKNGIGISATKRK